MNLVLINENGSWTYKLHLSGYREVSGFDTRKQAWHAAIDMAESLGIEGDK